MVVITRGIVVAGALAVFLCAGVAVAQKVEIKTNQAPDTDFNALKTYAWLPPVPVVKNVAPDAVTNPTLSEEALVPHIVSAIEHELESRGLRKGPFETADLHVADFAALTVGFNQTYLGEYYGYLSGWASPIPIGLAPTTSVSMYEKGTVLVDLVHRVSNKAIWRATAVTRIAQEHSLEKRVARINEAAKKMFEKYPVRPVK